MRIHFILTSIFLLTLAISQVAGQVVIRGKVMDDVTGEPVIGAVVEILGTTKGTVANYNGEYFLKVDSILPISIKISIGGYASDTIKIFDASQLIKTRLKEEIIALSTAEVFGTGIPEKHKTSAKVIVSLDLEGIKGTEGPNFYDGLGKLPGVDEPGSIGYKIINTRGFNSTSPIRSLQIIDGVDNQAPGLNFSLGNFLGASELDVLRVDIIVGANGAYYGPNAFNGVISMETKSPFFHTGLSAVVKAGERNLWDGAIRFADVIKNKAGFDFLAYKLNFAALRADDWKAENYDPITESEVPKSNPGRYDAVNIYGDEYYITNDFSGQGNYFQNPGLSIFYRTGYKEAELVDYTAENYKANLAIHLRTKPSKSFESPELILSSNFGSGTTIYQGDNRFSLKDIMFFQHRLEYRQKERYFFRVYYTHEDAGQSYDPYFTALRLQELSKTDQQWGTDYRSHWKENYVDRMKTLGYPMVIFIPPDSNTFDYAAADLWLITYVDSLAAWHASTADYANLRNIRNPPSVRDFLVPGSDEFNIAFDDITYRLNNEDGGTRFFDQSALFHAQGEYTFSTQALFDIKMGANYRLYAPSSKGTIFSDTAGMQIRNDEIGIYAGFEKKIFADKLTTSVTLRLDKNQNFNWIQTPAASLVYAATDKTFLRLSFSSAIRNPTLSDQYLYLNVGPAILSGHIDKVDSLITVKSFREYLDYLDPHRLRYFDIDPIRPEQVQTIEGGLRTTLFRDLYVDLGYYRSSYKDFLGYLIGITAVISSGTLPLPEEVQVFRYSANSKNKVTSQGFSVAINYYLSRRISFSGNYSFNDLRKTVVDDPIIPAYNTPMHKFNLGVSGKDIHIGTSGVFRNMGFSINYKWVEGFQFEGSPQFTGYVPSYGILDAQVSVDQDKLKSTFKVGVSNMLNNEHYETYGGPSVGRLAYVSIAYNF